MLLTEWCQPKTLFPYYSNTIYTVSYLCDFQDICPFPWTVVQYREAIPVGCTCMCVYKVFVWMKLFSCCAFILCFLYARLSMLNTSRWDICPFSWYIQGGYIYSCRAYVSGWCPGLLSVLWWPGGQTGSCWPVLPGLPPVSPARHRAVSGKDQRTRRLE